MSNEPCHAETIAAEPEPRAKHLVPALPAGAAPPDLVPARMINEALYCERLMYLEWVQGEFADNRFTVEGRLAHRRADTAGGKLPPERREDDDEEKEGEADEGEPPYVARSVWLSSEALGITAKIDVVEGDASGEVVPIEYKRGRPPESGVPYLPERAQLAAQALLLREHGYTCRGAAIYYAGAHQRVAVAIDDDLVATVHATVRRVREVTSRRMMPPPLYDDRRCVGCSLVGICLPDETSLLGGIASGAVSAPPEPESVERPADEELDGAMEQDPWELAGAVQPKHVMRRLHPARDDKTPLYVQEQGAYIGLDGERLVVRRRKEAVQEVSLPLLSQVALLGNVQISTQAMRSVLERGLPVSFFSYGGWFYGRARGMNGNNVDLRLAQYRAATDGDLCLRVARGLVVSKIKNSRTMLRRNASGVAGGVLDELERLARKAAEAESLAELLGLEGTAARTYFGSFTSMLRSTVGERPFDLDGRNRRPPLDPVNAMLSFAYALLTKDFTLTLDAVGLDPMLGFYHQTRFGRPSLALDLMEEFRPLVADSVVIGVVNNGTVVAEDFVTVGRAVALEAKGRRKFIQAYERRMDQLVTHPVFGYRISYRRVLEVQARLLGRFLMGEIEEYPSFRTR